MEYLHSTTVFAVDNKKYLSTGLTHVEPVRPEYYAPDVTLTEVQFFGNGDEVAKVT